MDGILTLLRDPIWGFISFIVAGIIIPIILWRLSRPSIPANPKNQNNAPPVPPQPHFTRRQVLTALGLAGLGVIAVAFYERVSHISLTVSTLRSNKANLAPKPTKPPEIVGAKTIYTYHVQSLIVLTAIWSPDGQRIASFGRDHPYVDGTHIWKSLDGTDDIVFPTRKVFTWSPDGQYILITSNNLLGIGIQYAMDNKEIVNYNGHTDKILHALWSPDGTQVASGSFDGTIQIWDPKSGRTYLTYKKYFADTWEEDFTWSPDSKYIASTAYANQGDTFNGTVDIWDAKTGEAIYTYKTNIVHTTLSVSWSPDGKQIAIAGIGGVETLDVKTGKFVLGITNTDDGNYGSWAEHVSWSPDGKLAATAQGNGSVTIWNPFNKDTPVLFTYYGHTNRVHDVSWSPNGKYIASASDDGTVQVWELIVS